MDWKEQIRNVLCELEKEYKLPEGSLWLSDNMSQSNPSEVVSHSVGIWEPDYPRQQYSSRTMNRIVFTMSLSTALSRPDDLDVSIRDNQWNALKEKLPADAVELPQTKTDKENRVVRVRISRYSNELPEMVRMHTRYVIDNYESKADGFACCSKYEQCSDAGRCLHENLLYSRACGYRKKIEQGIIFYGKNKNNC